MQRNSRGQAWYLARHLKHLSGNLAAAGFSEAALLVGAAALSVGDRAIERGEQPDRESGVVPMIPCQQGGARHG